MKKLILFAFCLLGGWLVHAQEWKSLKWPVLKHYDQQHLYRIALPLGGIGTGTVSLGGRGELRDWEIMNVPAKQFSTVTPGNNAPFFAIYTKEPGKEAQTTLLTGPLYDMSICITKAVPWTIMDFRVFQRLRSMRLIRSGRFICQTPNYR